MNSLDDASLRKIIEEEIARYLSELSCKPAPRASSNNLPMLLVILDGTFSPLDEVFTQLQALARFYRLVGLATEHFRAAYSAEFLRERCAVELLPAELAEDDLESALAQAELVLAPVLTRDTIVKSALGLSDSPSSFALVRALLAKKQVIAISDFALAELEQSAGEIVKPAPSSLVNLMHQYLERLRQWGVGFVKPADIFRSVEAAIAGTGDKTCDSLPPRPPFKRQIVTVEDLQGAKQFGQKRFRIERNGIVTDEARDYAAREGIALDYD
jgi:hypothetical protein